MESDIKSISFVDYIFLIVTQEIFCDNFNLKKSKFY